VFKFTEDWPVVLDSVRRLSYVGSGINDRDYGGNNFDFVGTSFLYDINLERERYYHMMLRDLNVTVLAVDESGHEYIAAVDYMPVRQLGYRASSVSAGIADLKYGQAGQNQISLTKGRITYDLQAEQRYYGLASMNLTLNATTWHRELPLNQSWLSACEICGADMDLSPEDAYLETAQSICGMNKSLAA